VSAAEFRELNTFDRVSNKLFGALVAPGFGLAHNYLLEVRGRRTGRVYATPVNVLDRDGKRFLVAPRGRAQWVRNAEATGEIVLRKGSRRERCRIRVVGDDEKPEILKSYLDRFALTVQRYFSVRAGSSASAFRAVAARYPVFELIGL
jgi:deazaflavin-dependent oxidoreductase (nitroreductase family)